MFAKGVVKTKVSNVQQAKLYRGADMKRLLALILVLTVLVITGTIVSADGQTVSINNFKTRQIVFEHNGGLSDGIR